MPRIAFAVESGTDGHSRCYSIGVISVPQERRDWLNATVVALKATHGIVGEAKWTRVRNSHGAINFVLDCLALVLRDPDLTFDVIVVNKRLYRNWRGDASQQEVAFYKTYTYLLRHVVNRLRDQADVYIDSWSDRYGKRDEAMATIGNRMLAKLAAKGTLGGVTKIASHDAAGIQLADVLTGAFNTAHMLRLQPLAIHPGKLITLERMAALIGWPHLGHDTYPEPKLNVWHFPIESRGPTMRLAVATSVPYASRDDLRAG